jgi:hypothetical protein
MPNEREEAREKHSDTMRRLENLRDDVKGIISDAINKFFDYPPETLDGVRTEQGRIREYLHDARNRIDSVINEL